VIGQELLLVHEFETLERGQLAKPVGLEVVHVFLGEGGAVLHEEFLAGVTSDVFVLLAVLDHYEGHLETLALFGQLDTGDDQQLLELVCRVGEVLGEDLDVTQDRVLRGERDLLLVEGLDVLRVGVGDLVHVDHWQAVNVEHDLPQDDGFAESDFRGADGGGDVGVFDGFGE